MGSFLMIVDRIQNADLYINMHARFQAAFDFLRQDNIADLETGEYQICGKDVYANVASYETLPADEGECEAHRKYIDLQFIADGKEHIGYSPLEEQALVEEYCDDRDVAFYDGTAPSFVSLSSGMFAIFFPDDAHKPCRYLERSSKVKKIVVKIAV